MKVSNTNLPDVVVIEPDVHEDRRGFFLETYHRSNYASIDVECEFVQDNYSRSQGSVLRGLHFQRTHPQGKLVRVVRGSVYDVAVDLNPESDTFKNWFGIELSEANLKQIYIAPGYAHGFLVLTDVADVEYKCTDYYNPADEVGIIWNDSELAIDWPLKDAPLLSEKDAALPTLSEFLNTL